MCLESKKRLEVIQKKISVLPHGSEGKATATRPERRKEPGTDAPFRGVGAKHPSDRALRAREEKRDRVEVLEDDE